MRPRTLAVIGIIISIIAIVTIPLFIIVDRWYSDPYAKMNLQVFCPSSIVPNEKTKFKVLFNNVGDAAGKFFQCVSSSEFIINGQHQTCSAEVELKRRRDFESYYSYPEWEIEINNIISKQIEKASFIVQVFCNQKIWFLKRHCGNKSHKCEYIKKNDRFELANKK